MYRIIFFLPLLLLLQTCEKEASASDNFTFNGTLLDATTRQPLAGVPMMAYSAGGDVNDAWNGTLYVDVHHKVVTDAGGQFDFFFDINLLGKFNNSVTIGTDQLPDNYQYYVESNADVTSILVDVNNYYELSESEKLQVQSGMHRDIYVYPKASFRFVFPQITNTHKKDTLVMYYEGKWPNNGSFSVYLGNTQQVQSFRSVRPLINANRMKGYFELRRNGVVHTGIFDMLCTPQDTTDIPLDWN